MPPKSNRLHGVRQGDGAMESPREKHYKKRQSSSEHERQACRRLATAMHTKLPRELRDVVYKHAIEEPKLFYVHDLLPDKNADVESVRRVYSQSYVGLEVAREAAEYYYSREHIIANFQDLRETLTRDVFHLGVKPYMHIQTLHVRIRIDEISGSLVRRGGTDHNGRLKESQSVKEAVVQEKINLNNLYQKLEAGFSLFKGTREPSFLKLVVNLKMDKYPPCWDRVYQRDITIMRDHERRFMNALETIRKPVYDMIHTGCNVEVKFAPEYYNGQERDDGRCDDDDSESETLHYLAGGRDKGSEKSDENCHCDDDPDDGLAVLNLTPSLFYLSKEEWEKEKATHNYLHGRYNPKAHYKSQVPLRYTRINKHYQMDFARNLPQYRARWGYTSYEKLLRVGQYMDGNLSDDEEAGSEASGGYPMPMYTNSSRYSDSERPDGWVRMSEEEKEERDEGFWYRVSDEDEDGNYELPAMRFWREYDEGRYR